MQPCPSPGRALDRTIAQFVQALRKADVNVSPAETLDAMRVARFVGVKDVGLLREALGLALAKTPSEKARFATCFERFFAFSPFTPALMSAAQPARSAVAAQFAMQGALDSLRVRSDAQRDPAAAASDQRPLAELLLADDQAELALRLAQAAWAVGVIDMRALRDKATMVQRVLDAMGAAEVATLLRTLDAEDATQRELALLLRGARARLQREIRDYVETQYLVHVDATGKRAILEAALSANLTQIQPAYYEEVRLVVKRIAERLTSQHKRRRKRARRGMLDVRTTLRKNLGYDGALFDLSWKKINVRRPKVFAICDVSGSVARVARFMLLLLYSLNELLPNIRTFAFSSQLGEVTDLFARLPVERAIEEALFSWGKGTTDYARAFTDLRNLCLKDIDRRSTVLILGDGRNNHFDPRPEMLAEISARAKQVLWLNPEPKDQWRVGDAEMQRFLPFCLRAETCNSVRELAQFADQLLLSR